MFPFDDVIMFLANLNIDFWNIQSTSLHHSCLDILYLHSVSPVFTKPTTIKKDSARLIDHIFTNNIDIDNNHI